MQLQRRLLLPFLAAILVAVVDVAAHPDRIITHGYSASIGQVPYIVGLLLQEGQLGRWCGGSIIDHKWVLTAAHCTDHIDAVTIYYGATRRTQALFSLIVGVEDVVQHPQWPGNIGNDIALIRTPHVGFWSLIDKVELPGLAQRNERFVHSAVLTCGWGSTYDGSSLPDWLQCIDLNVISNEECTRSYGTLPESVLCVGTPEGRSICDGDSGGPLVTQQQPQLVGVTSFSDAASCLSVAPAGFTRVTSHLDWIRRVSGVAY
ncbi:serine protease 1 [Drosophila grimshawi]|uniref:GH14856 n=1 Tax=Drosophila grimshawi TaxID=7222 RepID=B4J2K5_DROGR|nr:serine protease 1 [Drosophila grimshawi]EDV97090.1 GH14856 [Drosophila grimshawi]